jgi:hypothetical protein
MHHRVPSWRAAACPALGIAILPLFGPGPPAVVSLSPGSAIGSALTLTIEGSGFDAAASVPEVYRADGRLVATGSAVDRSPTRIVATVPLSGASPGSYVVKVANPGGARSAGATLTLVDEVSVSPRSGRPGTPFTYTGRGFTGRSSAISHLQGPDGLEWQAKRIGLSDEGTFERVIESGEFVPGTYTVWAIDDHTKVTSRSATFTVVEAAKAPAQ